MGRRCRRERIRCRRGISQPSHQRYMEESPRALGCTAESWASSCGELQDTECQTVLRVFHLPNHSQVPTSSFDITVQPFTEEWHIHTGKTGGKFRADIGIRTPTGSFRQIASSNIVQTPRGRATTIDESGVPKVEDYSFPFPPAQPGTSPMDW